MLEARGNPEFQQLVLRQLGMAASPQRDFDLYTDGSGGFVRLYGRPGRYTFGVADYTVPRPFAIRFDVPGTRLRFGAMYDGVTHFSIEDIDASASVPSAFVVLEGDQRGVQEWEAGQHYCGAEFTVYPAFLRELEQRLSRLGAIDLTRRLVLNHTYHYLPIDLLAVLQRVSAADAAGRLDPLALEAAVTQSVGALLDARLADGGAPRAGVAPACGDVAVGANRRIRLTAEDVRTIERAHGILAHRFANPPTIDALSRTLNINPQKLTAGFKRRYHTTIGKYVAALRMAQAAVLLCTTEEPVAAIAARVGYAHPSNFIKAFERTYSATPQHYRTAERRRATGVRGDRRPAASEAQKGT